MYEAEYKGYMMWTNWLAYDDSKHPGWLYTGTTLNASPPAKQEVAEFHRFQKLCGDIAAVSEKICALRSVEDTLTPQEKKRPKRSTRRSGAK